MFDSTWSLVMLIKEVKDSVTYCILCGSTLIWDNAGRPKVLKLGNNKLVHCLETGCNLIWTNIPYEASEALNPDMIRLALSAIWSSGRGCEISRGEPCNFEQ